MVTIYITTFIIFIYKTHGNYSPYKPIMIIYMRISHYSIIVVATIFYLKPMDIDSIITHGKSYSQETLEVTI